MKNTRSITSGAMTVALTGIILFLDRITVGLFMSFLGIPLMVYGYFFTFNESIIVYISIVLLSVIVSGMLPTVVMMAGYGLVGLSFIWAKEKGLSTKKLLTLMGIVLGFVYIIMVLFFGEYFGFSIGVATEAVRSFLETLGINATWGVDLVAYLLLFVTYLMELFVIYMCGNLIINMLSKHKKS